MRNITKLFGNRVALQLLEEEYKGLIVPASTIERMYVLSKVVAKGDKVTQDINVGDILFWQTNGLIQKQCRHDINGVATFVLMTGDMIARLTSQVVDRESFHCIGDWCLVTREIVQPKLLIIPDEVADANQETTVKWTLVEKGETVDTDIAVGDELIVDRTRCNPIKLGEAAFYYIHKNFVLGTIR